MKAVDLDRFLRSTLNEAGFTLEQVDEPSVYGDRPAWALYYRGKDCKLQICWSARDGGIDFMLAAPDAPNEFGLTNKSRKWRYMLMLSNIRDDLLTPAPGASDAELMGWMKALFDVHFQSARTALRG